MYGPIGKIDSCTRKVGKMFTTELWKPETRCSTS